MWAPWRVQAQSLQVPMRVREEGREERTAPVLVSVSIETDREAASRRQLMVFQVRLQPLCAACPRLDHLQ